MNEKMQWIRNKLSSMNLQGMIVSDPVNIQYLTNLQAEGLLILTRKENIYITDGRYVEYVNKTLTVFDEITVYDAKDISLDDYENFFMFCENVGFEEEHLTYAKYKEYKRKFKINNFVETESIIEKQRMIKDAEELQNIQKACSITRNCFEYIAQFLKPGNTEKQVARLIDDYYYKHSEGPSFETIVASGENSSKPHAVPTDRAFLEQDIITIDMGCKYNGYCSDMTRTFFIGKPTEKQKSVYDLVAKNHSQTIDAIKDGANIKQLVKMVENDFKLNDYDLIHSLGHGVGLDVHEKPNLSIRVDAPLRENMIVTVEPGIYIPGEFGVRIEDTVVVEKGGARIL